MKTYSKLTSLKEIPADSLKNMEANNLLAHKVAYGIMNEINRCTKSYSFPATSSWVFFLT